MVLQKSPSQSVQAVCLGSQTNNCTVQLKPSSFYLSSIWGNLINDKLIWVNHLVTRCCSEERKSKNKLPVGHRCDFMFKQARVNESILWGSHQYKPDKVCQNVCSGINHTQHWLCSQMLLPLTCHGPAAEGQWRWWCHECSRLSGCFSNPWWLGLWLWCFLNAHYHPHTGGRQHGTLRGWSAGRYKIHLEEEMQEFGIKNQHTWRYL